MKQSTIILIAVIFIIVFSFVSGIVGYKLHTCHEYIDTPIEKPHPDSSRMALIERLTKELKQRDSLLKIKPKIIIHEKAVYYRDLNRDALCDSIDKYFKSGFDLL